MYTSYMITYVSPLYLLRDSPPLFVTTIIAVMALNYETTHEYYIKDPAIFWCEEHNGLCLTQDYEDTLRITGVSDKSIIKFVNGLYKHYPELAASFEKGCKLDTKASSRKATQGKAKSTD